MKNKLTLKKIRFLFIATLVSVGIFMTATYLTMVRSEREMGKVKSSLDFLLSLENIMNDVQAIETGQRGYIISGDEKFLDPHNSGLKSINTDTVLLKSIPADPLQEARRVILLKLIDERIDHSKSLVETRRLHGFDSAADKIQIGIGKLKMDSIRQVVDEMEMYDRDFLRRANLERDKYSNRSFWQLLLLTAIFYAVLFYSYVIITRDFNQLQESERNLKYNASLIRNISDPIITTDKEFRITNWNLHAERLYGFKEEEVKGKTVDEVLKIGYVDLQPDDILEQFKKNAHWKGEVIHHHKNGTPINVEVTSSSVKDNEGNETGLVAVIRDITMRKKMEGLLQEKAMVQSAELNNVFERITDAFIALDSNWNYVYVNHQAGIMHGRDPQELVGKNIWTEFPDVKNEEFYDALHKAQQTQMPQRLQLYYSTTGKWFEDLIYPSEQGVSVYYHDITERKKAELALKESNERFELVARATNDAIWDWNMLTDKIWGNNKFHEIFDVREGEEFNFKNFLERIHDDDRQVLLDNFKNALYAKQTLITEEFRFRRASGGYRTLYDRAYIIYDNNQRGIRMLGAMEDITEERESEKKLFLEKELSDSIINSLPGVFYLYNQKGQFYRWNKNFEDVTGYTSEEILKLHPIDLFPENERELLAGKIANVFVAGEDSVEAHFMLKDGTLIPYFFTGRLISYEGEICLMGVGMDVSERKRSQEKLIESELKFRTLIEQASDGIFISDNNGNYIDVNTSASIMTGYSESELLQMNLRDIMVPEDLEERPAQLDRLKDGKVLLTERRLKHKSGNYLDVEISSKMLPDGRYQGIVRDITFRKKAEEKIRNTEEQRRLIMNAALDAIICIDTNGMITFWNPQAEKIFGWSYNEVLNKRLSEVIIPHKFRSMHDKGIETYMASGKGPALNVLLELTAINRAGTEFPVELTVLPITQGGDTFFCAFIRDITLRKKAEEELRLSEHKYRLLFTQNPMPMWMISIPERDFLDVNPSAINFYGYSREEFLNMNIRDIRPAEEVPKLSGLTERPPGIYNAGVWTHQKKDGSLVQVNIVTHDIFYEGQNCKLVLSIDVTDKIAAEENLRKSHEEFRQLALHLENIRESERTHMAREVHDELGQQLTGLKMDISWLKRRINTDDTEIQLKINDTIELIDKTVISVRRIATELRPSILDDLGLIAAMEWQTGEFQKRSEISSSFETNIPNIELPSDIATGLFRIYQECLTNVSRHSGASLVKAGLHKTEQGLELTISDNGKGFDASEIASKKTLGLLGMKERTGLMGGKYTITSQPGVGTSVRIIVPLKES